MLTFFLTESFSYWRRTLCEVRKLQRALVNIALLQVPIVCAAIVS